MHSENVLSQPRMSSKLHEDLEDRDPNKLNQHVEIIWDTVIGEPQGVRSPECVWRLSRCCFQNSKNFCYTFLALICAAPLSLILGCSFACMAFQTIWLSTPYLRCLKIIFAYTRTLVLLCTSALVVPCFDAIGHVCRHIRVNLRRDAPEDRDPLII